jgi:hypothetical protein
MATGGIFTLITNDGKQDRLLLATALLNKRLLEIERARSNNPAIKDPTPTLVDIERTHILFMNAHFKPFAAIGYEYNRVQAQSGSARLGAEVQFSIPQFGDFFNDMALHLTLSSVTATNASYWTTGGAHTATGAELIAYVNNPGQRIVKRTQFNVNGNPLDEYDSDVYNFHEKFFVTPNKQVGWNRAMGQEVAMQGFSGVCGTTTGTALTYTPGGALGLRTGVEVFNGPQTPKPVQPALDIWAPLIFWFNKDPRLAIPSVSIPYGQRFINVQFAAANEILQHVSGVDAAYSNPAVNPVNVPTIDVCDLYINNIFVNPEIHDIFIKRIGFSLIRVHRRQVARTSKSQESILLNQLKWPVETLYAGLRPVSNISEADPKMLTSWNILGYVYQRSAGACGSEEYLEHLVAAPATTLAGALDTWYINAGPAAFTNTGRQIPGLLVPVTTFLGVGAGVQVTVAQLNSFLSFYGAATYDPAHFVNPLIPTAAEVSNAAPEKLAGGLCCEISYDEVVPTVSRIEIEAHGVPLYREMPASFFNHYIPYTYGSQHIKTPTDVGAYMITFNLYPGSYQPSGYMNASRAREFYFKFITTAEGALGSNDLVIVGITINFLLISDGSAVLRYST